MIKQSVNLWNKVQNVEAFVWINDMNKSKPANEYEPRMDPATTNHGIVKRFWKQKYWEIRVRSQIVKIGTLLQVESPKGIAKSGLVKSQSKSKDFTQRLL
jgi:hypothetical protein